MFFDLFLTTCSLLQSEFYVRELLYTLLLLNMTSEKNAQVSQAREAFQMMYQISQLLCTGLDPETLSICISLCELGVDPEVLAHVIKEIRKIGTNAAQNKTMNLQS